MLLFGISGPALHGPGLGSSASDACNNACFNSLDGDDLTACVNACGNNTTRTACQVDCSSLSGSAYSTCTSACSAYPETSSGAGAGGGTTTSNGGTPWYASILTAVGAGAGAALRPAAPGRPLPVAAPWYQSPIGIGAIAVGVIGLVMLLKK